MESEIEFLEHRLQILEKNINAPVKFDTDERGRFYLRFEDSPSIEHAYIREAHLIKKLLAQAKEGKVNRALAGWHQFLFDELRKHHEHYKKMQEKYDEWSSLPFPTRIDIPEPPHPPDLEIRDIQNDNWIVDETLLDLIKDMRSRLSKWMASSD
ncbi:MAG TPA: hypothetical protein VMT91_11335 [Anaerolineales bacterium]|nr:hypothetical protein [Anaerolineales bacterium]